ATRIDPLLAHRPGAGKQGGRGARPGVANAAVAGVVRLTSGEGHELEVEVRASATRDRLSRDRLEPSRRLVQAAVQRRQAVFYRWDRAVPQRYTAHASIDWALCVPLPEPLPAGWALYAAGSGSSSHVTETPDAVPTSDLKFTGVVADIFASLHEVYKLQA